jgi:3-phenylpropionate/trans-cinnamate dioxygenase ferredoxin subunit
MIVDVDGHSIGVFNVEGKLFALLNRCPHQGAALCQGTVTRVLEADQPGAYRYDAERPLLQCPWHSWEFDLRTGQSYFDPARTRVRSYDVDVESGSALAESEEGTQGGGLQPGPYVADTFAVDVEDAYIVVHIGGRARKAT